MLGKLLNTPYSLFLETFIAENTQEEEDISYG